MIKIIYIREKSDRHSIEYNDKSHRWLVVDGNGVVKGGFDKKCDADNLKWEYDLDTETFELFLKLFKKAFEKNLYRGIREISRYCWQHGGLESFIRNKWHVDWDDEYHDQIVR